MRKKIFIILIALISVFGLFYYLKTPSKPNIIVILVDALRKDHLGCYGYSRNTSPNIDRLASEEFNYHQGFDHFKQVGTSFRPSAAVVRESTISWLKDKPKEPFSLYIHFMDVHGPYIPPYPYDNLFTSSSIFREVCLIPTYNKL